MIVCHGTHSSSNGIPRIGVSCFEFETNVGNDVAVVTFTEIPGKEDLRGFVACTSTLCTFDRHEKVGNVSLIMRFLQIPTNRQLQNCHRVKVGLTSRAWRFVTSSLTRVPFPIGTFIVLLR